MIKSIKKYFFLKRIDKKIFFRDNEIIEIEYGGRTMEIGIVGLGKMGLNLALNLKDKNYTVLGMDISSDVMMNANRQGIKTVQVMQDFLEAFSGKKTIWIMLPAGEVTDQALHELLGSLESGDVVIEGGNSNYKTSIERAQRFQAKGIDYLDCGTSGGISGARHNACLMIGGRKETFEANERLFADIATKDGYLYAGASGSGHFLKMIHNGIEYGMMQAIGEGFQLVNVSPYEFELEKVARVWNHGSVIRGWLMEIMEEQFAEHPRLENYRGIVSASGEAKWTVETALEMEVPVPTIALSLFMRNLSQEEDSFSAKVVSALRNGFGGHDIVEKGEK